MSAANQHLFTRDLLRGVYDLLVPADVVTHKGLSMRLYPPDDAADPRWTATCDAADHDGGQAAGGYGDDPMEALDACAADVATQAAARRRLDEENDA